MHPARFKNLLDELDGNSLQTLKEKNARYAQNGDCLHNFKRGAAMNNETPAQTCWGYMSKHLVALQDKVENNDFSNREDFLEKCQDTINYIRFLWCIGNDEEFPDDAKEENVTKTLLDRCYHEGKPMHPYGDKQCLAEPGFELCHGHVNCDKYKPIDD